MPREYVFFRAFTHLGLLQWTAPALLIFAFFAWRDRRNEAVRFAALFVAAAFFFYFVQKLGVGVADNAQFELVAATAIGLGAISTGWNAPSSGRRSS